MNPKQLFLTDAIGALLTSLLLFLVLGQLDQYFRMPKNVLYLLSGIAFGLFIYSLSCYQFVKSKWKLFLSILIFLNSSYLSLSIVFIIKYFPKLTQLDLSYFIGEFVVIAILIGFELKTISKER